MMPTMTESETESDLECTDFVETDFESTHFVASDDVDSDLIDAPIGSLQQTVHLHYSLIFVLAFAVWIFVVLLIKYDTSEFDKNWYWNASENKIAQKRFNSVQKLQLTTRKIEGFGNGTKRFPFFNLGIIQIDDDYRELMMKSISTIANIQIVQNTEYILIGRGWNDQCKDSQFHSNEYQMEASQNDAGSNLILMDRDWKILSFVHLNLQTEQNEMHLKHIEDCRLFRFDSLIFTSCETFIGGHHHYIGALLWNETMIDGKMQIFAYLEARKDANIDQRLKTKLLTHTPKDAKIGSMAKNLVPLIYKNDLYFQWELSHSYFIKVDLMNDPLIGEYAYHNEQKYHLNGTHFDDSLHLNAGFIHLKESNEYLGIAHIHYDYKDVLFRDFGINGRCHYVHIFYTIEDTPPFNVKRMSEEFYFGPGEIIQFVTGMIEVDDFIFLSYGINDCIGSVAQMNKSSVINMLKNVTY